MHTTPLGTSPRHHLLQAHLAGRVWAPALPGPRLPPQPQDGPDHAHPGPRHQQHTGASVCACVEKGGGQRGAAASASARGVGPRHRVRVWAWRGGRGRGALAAPGMEEGVWGLSQALQRGGGGADCGTSSMQHTVCVWAGGRAQTPRCNPAAARSLDAALASSSVTPRDTRLRRSLPPAIPGASSPFRAPCFLPCAGYGVHRAVQRGAAAGGHCGGVHIPGRQDAAVGSGHCLCHGAYPAAVPQGLPARCLPACLSLDWHTSEGPGRGGARRGVRG